MEYKIVLKCDNGCVFADTIQDEKFYRFYLVNPANYADVADGNGQLMLVEFLFDNYSYSGGLSGSLKLTQYDDICMVEVEAGDINSKVNFKFRMNMLELDKDNVSPGFPYVCP